MIHLKKIIYLVTFTILLKSCSNNDIIKDTSDFDYINLSSQDKIKVIVGEAISYLLANNPRFSNKLFSKLISEQNKTTELLFVLEKDVIFSDRKSLEAMLLEFYSKDQDKLALIKNINVLLPNLVIKIPQWTDIVLGDSNLNLDFAVYPSLITNQETIIYFKNGKQFNIIKSNNNLNTSLQYLPIQIKESEYLLLIEKHTNMTIWGDDFYKNHFPILETCSDFKRLNYTLYSNEIYDFVNRIAIKKDLASAKLCKI